MTAVLPLILVGAGVTSTGAGMAFPDWPTSDGYLVNPPGWMSDAQKLWEHGHRLIGWAVGMLAIAVTAVCWRRGATLRTIALATLAAIVVQGVLGGLRVREVSTALAMVHGIWGQACFCLTAVLALTTSRGWALSAGGAPAKAAAFYQRGCVVGLACTFVQLTLGAAYRHFGHRHALAAHLVWAVVVILVLSWLTLWTLEQYPGRRLLSPLGKLLASLIGVQMLLGGVAFLVKVMGGHWPFVLQWAAPSAHVLAGALMLGCVLALTLSSYHVLARTDDQHASTSAAQVAAL
jgi:cytochrome c oxidase assembly protein subunit 15